MITLNIEGKVLQERFARASERLGTEVEQRLREAGALVERAAAKNAATVLRVRSGRLVRSIAARAEGSGLETRIRVEAGAPYAAVHEFGRARIPARPFMRPALEMNRERMRKLLTEAFHETLS